MESQRGRSKALVVSSAEIRTYPEVVTSFAGATDHMRSTSCRTVAGVSHGGAGRFRSTRTIRVRTCASVVSRREFFLAKPALRPGTELSGPVIEIAARCSPDSSATRSSSFSEHVAHTSGHPAPRIACPHPKASFGDPNLE